jgi:putative nucleotidyltransferase-like protein
MAACCRWPPSPRRDEAVRRCASPPLRWDIFERLVARHRVGGLVHDGLRRAGIAPPADIAARLAAEARDIARQNLAFAAECARLQGLLEAAGTDFLFLKGVTLNRLAYDTLALKKAWDIDLLVDPADYQNAMNLIEGAGYRCTHPEGDPTREEILSWVERHKHSIWTNAAGTAVELHNCLIDNPVLLPGLSVRSPRQRVEIAPGLVLPTLAKDELFAYLCAHGAAHAWSRLKWLADAAALIKDDDEAEIARLHRRSVELGGGRSAGQALLLCARLFETQLPPALERALRGDLATRLLVRIALRMMVLGGLGKELDEMTFGTARIHLSYLLLGRGARYKLEQLRRTLLGAPSEGAPLPKRLVRPLLYLPRWVLGRVRRSREAAKPIR